MKRGIGLPVTTLARRAKSVIFALRSPPSAAGHIHVPGWHATTRFILSGRAQRDRKRVSNSDAGILPLAL